MQKITVSTFPPQTANKIRYHRRLDRVKALQPDASWILVTVLCPLDVTIDAEVLSHDGVADELDAILQHSQRSFDCACQSCQT